MPVNIKINGKQETNVNALFKDIEQTAAKVHNRIVMAVRLACLDIVRRARLLPSPPEELRGSPHQPNYIDFSGILRASIGFAVYDCGVKIAENFEMNGGGNGNKAEGMQKGIAIANETAAKFPNEICAVIVAGADYAAAVESGGYFVLSEPCSHLGEVLLSYLSKIKLQ